LHLDNDILSELKNFAPEYSETEIRSLLGCFLFSGDSVFKKIKILSGGEKSRVALAKVITSDANFLILDEPTNHLDIQSVNILIQALQQFEGTFIVVSHDRYLLDEVANKIWYIEDEKIKEYPGTYKEYEEWNTKREKEKKDALEPVKKEKKEKGSKTPVVTDEKKNLQKKLSTELDKIEKEIQTHETSKVVLEDLLSQEENYSNSQKLTELNNQYDKIKRTIIEKQAEWDELAEKLMELESE
jgi:ATP-binding cassette subfamily F protein 3